MIDELVFIYLKIVVVLNSDGNNLFEYEEGELVLHVNWESIYKMFHLKLSRYGTFRWARFH